MRVDGCLGGGSMANFFPLPPSPFPSFIPSSLSLYFPIPSHPTPSKQASIPTHQTTRTRTHMRNRPYGMRGCGCGDEGTDSRKSRVGGEGDNNRNRRVPPSSSLIIIIFTHSSPPSFLTTYMPPPPLPPPSPSPPSPPSPRSQTPRPARKKKEKKTSSSKRHGVDTAPVRRRWGRLRCSECSVVWWNGVEMMC